MFEAISSLSPWHHCLLSPNDSTMKTQEAVWRAMGLRSIPLYTSMSWVMLSSPPRLPTLLPSGCRGSLKPVSSRAASPQSLQTGNAILLWNITPSLTVSVYNYGYHPDTADGEEDDTRQRRQWPPSDANTDVLLSAKIAKKRDLLSLVKYEPVFQNYSRSNE